MIAEHVVDLSRFQFAATVLYHFLFVPLDAGMAFILAIMESVYVMTNNTVYRDMTKFWGKLFGINFALGVTTGLTMEFQFGTNWAYYSHYVGDIFGAPLAIEGLMAFFQSPPSSVCSSSVGIVSASASTWRLPGWWRSGPTSPHCGSWSPTAGCRTRWVPSSTSNPCAWRW